MCVRVYLVFYFISFSYLPTKFHKNVLLQEMNAVDKAMEQCVLTFCSASSGIRMVAAVCELSDNTNCNIDQFVKICGWLHGRLYKITELERWALHGNRCSLGGNTIQVMV